MGDNLIFILLFILVVVLASFCIEVYIHVFSINSIVNRFIRLNRNTVLKYVSSENEPETYVVLHNGEVIDHNADITKSGLFITYVSARKGYYIVNRFSGKIKFYPEADMPEKLWRYFR